jgi:hypothetical protein
MNGKALRLVTAASVFFLMVLPARGDESGAIDVKLTVQKMAFVAGREEVLSPAESIRPGDVLQYDLVYKIKGKDEVLELLAQLPIPPGMEYVSDSARPPKVRASLDGRDFSPVPLQRKIKGPNGQDSTEEIPAKEYRFLGWSMRGFAPGDEITVSARLKVNFIPEPGTTP